MSENYVEKRMLIAPSEIDGFAGAVTAFMTFDVVNGRKKQIAVANIYSDCQPRVTYSIPERVAFSDVPELTRLLAEFAQKTAEAVAQANA
jgi:hypothetical protein